MESQYDPSLLKQAKARVGFRMHLRTYLFVNAGLWLIWAISAFAFRQSTNSLPFPWPLFATLGWGIGLVSHYLGVYRSGNQQSMVDEEYQKLAKRQ